MTRKHGKSGRKPKTKGTPNPSKNQQYQKGQKGHQNAHAQAPGGRPPPSSSSFSLADEARWASGHRSNAFAADRRLRHMAIDFVSAGYLAGTLPDDLLLLTRRAEKQRQRQQQQPVEVATPAEAATPTESRATAPSASHLPPPPSSPFSASPSSPSVPHDVRPPNSPTTSVALASMTLRSPSRTPSPTPSTTPSQSGSSSVSSRNVIVYKGRANIPPTRPTPSDPSMPSAVPATPAIRSSQPATKPKTSELNPLHLGLDDGERSASGAWLAEDDKSSRDPAMEDYMENIRQELEAEHGQPSAFAPRTLALDDEDDEPWQVASDDFVYNPWQIGSDLVSDGSGSSSDDDSDVEAEIDDDDDDDDARLAKILQSMKTDPNDHTWNKRQSHVRGGQRTGRAGLAFPSASAMADALDLDPYNGFDIMDTDRPSLRRRKKGRRGQLPPELSDSNLNEQLQQTFENDRVKKRIMKAEREELRKQGLLGRKGKAPDLSIKYQDGIHMDDIVEEIRAFMFSDLSSLSLPPMAAHRRAVVHDMVRKLGVSSKSRGNGADRFTILSKTMRTKGIDDSYFDGLVQHKRYRTRFQHVSGASGKTARPGFQGTSYREGEQVGAFAPEIGPENKGHALLKKMGWSKGMALGALENKGILHPIAHTVKTNKAGLR